MHEYYVTEQIVKIACETARQHNAPSIAEIHIVIGELTGIVSESLSFYFEALARDTAADGAVLHFIRQPVSRLCSACSTEFHGATSFNCPACGTLGELINNGRAFYVDSVHLPD